ncbi:EAL domain-containing protein [Eubacterium limosum]|uniref:EAL domain-containing protein n=1 Tax=Eubacterium limosum TaxID=1736 RepID=UPI0022E95E3B|nr:EAL domain-containing protein [Eubacterium limosum]
MQNLFENMDMDAEVLYGLLSSICNDYLYIWDTCSDRFQVSPNTASDFCFEENSMAHYCAAMLRRIHPRDQERFRKRLAELWQSDETTFTLNYQMLDATGAYIWVNNRGRVRRNPHTGQPAVILGAMKSLEECEYVDYVTGLLHHRFCQEKFQGILDDDPDIHFKMLLLGIDEFNKINTLNSRTFGDKVLKTTAQEILKRLPGEVNLYRYEGDQFMVAGAGASREEMLSIYERIQQYARGAHRIDNQPYRFGVSAGLVSYPEDGDSWADLEKKAAVALKRAKHNGKNQCVEFKQGMLREQIDRQFLTNCMAESVENDFQGFRLVFQPLCDVSELAVIGAEALLRYRMPDGREISPVDFIPQLESSRLILKVGLWVLEQAAEACRAWVKWVPDFAMNVNVSYIQLREPDFCREAEAVLRRQGLAPGNLVLELTESYFMKEDANVKAALSRLRAKRIQLAMDDFGTGYSSLERLADLDVDIVKVDRFFVKALHTSQHNRDFIESVIRLCHNRRKKVCVEGVETREEWESVRLMNADCIQGFYVSRPVDRDFFFTHYVAVSFDGKSLAGAIDRERLQDHLVNDRELLFAMMNATPLSLMIWNRKFEILACNEEAVRLFGTDSRKTLIEGFYSYSPPRQPNGEDSEMGARDRIYEAFLEGRNQFKWQHVDEHGRRLPVEVTCVRIPYQNDYVVASYARDLRAEIEVEQSNKKFRKRLHALLNATPLCLNLWNKKFKNVMCNEEALKLFELEDEREYLAHFYALSPERQPDGQFSEAKAEAKITEAMQRGRTRFRWLHCKQDGTPIPAEVTLVRIDHLDDDGSAMVAGYTRDLREQIEAEKMQRILSARVRAVMDATPLSCILWNVREEILDCNQMAVEMFCAGSVDDVLRGFDSFQPLYQPDGTPSLEKKETYFREVKEKGYCAFEWLYENRQHEKIPCEVTLVRAAIKEDEDIIIAYSRDLRTPGERKKDTADE